MQVSIGMTVEKKVVAEIGEQNPFLTGNDLLPVKFTDGTCAVLVVSDEYNSHPWWFDTAEIRKAVRASVEMPRAARGAGGGVIYVSGVDATGPYFIKSYYNQKMERPDSLTRRS